MTVSANVRSLRRRLIAVAALVLVGFLVALLICASRSPQPPRVTATFSVVTNAPGGPMAVFNLTNESDLIVHVYAQEIGGVFVPCPFETIPPGKSAMLSSSILPPTDIKGLKTNTVSFSSPLAVEFYLRRQDTRFEEAREMLDSVLQSVQIAIPSLNPDSSRNQFRISSTIPAQH